VSAGCYQGSAVFYSTPLKFLYLGLFSSSEFLNLSFILHVQANVRQETGWMILVFQEGLCSMEFVNFESVPRQF
jgi:hypothetical protein